ncbi:hypothetical protein VTK73DRAFT_9199 [Phialemonium thermophilum]|uniref:Calcineurin-like phosphoesterase domain-containing protein n=1 Tax=Phialemonium thermophilum TaxID=223376 RepID=A0ABR3XMV6_9PEZI
MATPSYRRTRVICVSDTHNCPVSLPKGDVLIHAGDLTNQGTHSELAKAVQWLEKADFEAKIVVAGNHDITLDRDFYAVNGSHFHNQKLEDPEKCISLLASSSSITYLCHSQAVIRLKKEEGPQTIFKVFGSPYSPRTGNWAFMYEGSALDFDEDTTHSRNYPVPSRAGASTIDSLYGLPSSVTRAAEIWSAIPLDADIVVTHTPPFEHCDQSASSQSLGCLELRKALYRVRPRLHVCGHVHTGRGAELVRWDYVDGKVPTEPEVRVWQDPGLGPGNRRLSRVDLAPQRRNLEQWLVPQANQRASAHSASRARKDQSHSTACGDYTSNLPLSHSVDVSLNPSHIPQRRPLAPDCPRSETCVVNCSIMATSWPHVGGKRFNKPIVVDLDLPVWRQEPE